MDYNKIIGSNIRFERQKRDLTIEELSEILSIAPGFLGLIERGQRGTSIKNLCKIAEFFSISLDQLITRPAGTIIKTNKESVAEKSLATQLKEKHTTTLSLINGLSLDEFDFVISIVKGMRRLTKKPHKRGRKSAAKIDETKENDEIMENEADVSENDEIMENNIGVSENSEIEESGVDASENDIEINAEEAAKQ